MRRASAEPVETSALEEVLKKLDSLKEVNAPAPVSREGFDVNSKAARLGKDVDKIFAFVRDEVRIESYRGVLKGARGALMAKAGNSFDRAILLASLLEQAGFQVRYAHGTLNEETASQLLSATPLPDQRLAAPSPNTERPALSAELKDGFDKLGKLTAARWAAAVHQLQAALLAKAKLWDDQPRSLPALAVEARDHVWVEYRQNDIWVALDPAARKPGDSLTKATGTWPSIPASMFHKVTIHVIREELGPNGLTTRDLLGHEARADELDGAEVSLHFDVKQTGAGWSATPVLLIGARTIRGRPAAGSGVAGAAPDLGARLFQRPGESPKKSGGEVTATWLEFKFSSPRGETETLRREIFDRIGPAARASHRENDALLAALVEKNGVPLYAGNQYAFSFSSGPIDPELLNSYLAPHLPALRDAYPLTKKLQAENRALTEKETAELGRLLGPTIPSQLGSVARVFHELSWQSLAVMRDKRLWENVRFYADSPRLAIASMEPRLDQKGNISAAVSLDLRRNDLRAVGKNMNANQLAWANVVRGSLDAVLEDIVLRLNLDARERIKCLSSVALLERLREKGTPLEAVASLDEIGTFKIPEAIRGRMSADAGKGVLLFSSRDAIKVQDMDRMAWWRLDLTSGETLGIMDTGLHQSVAENTSAIAAIVVGCAGVLYTWRDFLTYENLIGALKTGDLSDMADTRGSNGAPIR